MSAYRACRRCFRTDDDVSAVAADPYAVAVAREYDAFFDILKQAAVAFLVVTFDGGNRAETIGDSGEAFFVRFGSHAVVHIRPFVVFAFCGCLQIFRSIANAGKLLEPEFCVLFLIFCCL